MAGILNGMALHGGFRVYGSTFLVFLDYCRSSVRLSAMMGLPVVYVFTHDSIYVGEDGPTHQPISHFASLRCIPNMTVIRPADATETNAAWMAALKNKTGPTVLLLTRHNLPVIDRAQYPAAAMLEKGAYTLWQSAPGLPDILLIASGSEVFTALDAAKLLAKDSKVRVVSMPSWELFETQDMAYRDSVLPAECQTRVVVEAACSMGWEKYAGDCGKIVGISHFGASAPYKILAQKYGFTPEHVAAVAKELLKENSSCSCCGN